jgi:hypothetical protein
MANPYLEVLKRKAIWAERKADEAAACDKTHADLDPDPSRPRRNPPARCGPLELF